jgi:hypothetical protein
MPGFHRSLPGEPAINRNRPVRVRDPPEQKQMTQTTTTNPYPDVVTAPGAATSTAGADDDPQPYRIILGADRSIVDHPLEVRTSSVRWADATVDDGRIEPPPVWVYDVGESKPLNSDQARELASALLQAAHEIDRWMGRTCAESSSASGQIPVRFPSRSDSI